tara:strand:+ start:37227 stop:39818 length:2592 start_codon:yes stop_codon:yes gene_type:complete
MKVKEAHKKKLREAIASGRANEKKKVLNDIEDELETYTGNKAMDEDAIDDYLEELETQIKILTGPKDLQSTTSMEQMNQMLKENFTYNFKEVSLERLRSLRMNAASLVINKDSWKNKGFKDSWANTVSMYSKSGELTQQEVSNLKLMSKKVKDGFKNRSSKKVRGSPMRRTRSIPDILGDIDLGDMNGRDKIYKFWSSINDDYPKVEAALKSFLKYDRSKIDEDMLKKLERLESVSKAKNLQYIIECEPEALVLDPADVRAFDLIKEYLSARGYMGKNEGDDERSQLSAQQLDSAREGANQRATAALSGGAYSSRNADSDLTAAEEFEQAVAGNSDDAYSGPTIDPTQGKSSRELDEIKYKDEVGWLDELDKKTLLVDPLLNYYFQENKNFVPIGKGELNKFKRELDNYQGTFSNPQMNEEYAEFIENLKENIEAYDNQMFYLPFTETFKDIKVQGNAFGTKLDENKEVIPFKYEDKFEEVSKDIAEFLNAFASVIEDYETQFPMYSAKGNKGVKGVQLPDAGKKPSQSKDSLIQQPNAAYQIDNQMYPELSIPGLKGKKAQVFITDENFNKRLQKLISVIMDYYIDPLNRKYFFDNEKPRWTSDKYNASAAIDRIEIYGDSNRTEAYTKYLEDGTAGMTGTNFKNITFFLKDITGSISQLDDGVLANARASAQSFRKIIGKSNSDIIDAWIGSSLYTLLDDKERNKPEYTFPYKNKNRTLKFLFEQYRKLDNNNTNPVIQVHNLIMRFEDDILQDNDVKKDVLQFIEQINRLNKKSKVEIRLMDAHDAIRKMKGLPIYYGRYYLNDPDSLDEIVTKMETKHSVDLAASEVYDIVKTVDSMKNIAISHGLTEELVYELKANFR